MLLLCGCVEGFTYELVVVFVYVVTLFGICGFFVGVGCVMVGCLQAGCLLRISGSR